MRVIKGIVLFCFSVLLVSSCFDPPEFSDIPKITFQDIRFKEVGGASDPDSLILYLNFTDGDGDVGLSSLNSDDFDPPYNAIFYYLADGTGDTTRVTSKSVSTGTGGSIYTILNAEDLDGKLVTSKTRSLPNYGYLPTYNPNSCLNYDLLSNVLVPLKSIDNSYDIQDTIKVNGLDYAQITEAVFYRSNPNHYNIDVTFERFVAGDFQTYDWYREFCIEYDGRFPTSLSQFPTYPDRPIEGTIRYAMANTSFLAVFGNTPIRIKARIRDRALHVSNEVVTPQFDLNSIR